MNKIKFLKLPGLLLLALTLNFGIVTAAEKEKTPVDYVNPYIGNISHLLVPTYPTISLPNSMLRVYPERGDFTGDVIRGLPIIVTSHRGSSAFSLSPYQGDEAGIKPVLTYSYDNEIIKPYYYYSRLDEAQMDVRFAPSHQSAVYEIGFDQMKPTYLIINSRNGEMVVNGDGVSGFQDLRSRTKVYIYLETEQKPEKVTTEKNYVKLYFGDKVKQVKVRYGISYISEEQAKKNLKREISDYSVDNLANKGREIWNQALGKILVKDDNLNNKTVFYTSLYRVFERPICISEDGKYFSAFDAKVHDDEGKPFFTDDWIWDTYRAAHPLRLLIDSKVELGVINSYIRMAQQSDRLWMPTFPGVTGDSHAMNSNHGVATIADAWAKGMKDFDLKTAYLACKQAIEEKTLAPWSAKPAGSLDAFYKEHGYFPALKEGETETVPEVSQGEKRQPIAVTLGTSYDTWCLSQLAGYLNDTEASALYLKKSYNYRNVFNPKTKFFHPKDKDGNFLEPFDYRFSGGQGARDAYDENNGWVYRWDVQHNIGDLVQLMGGGNEFCKALDDMYREPLGKGKFTFLQQLPDHTGNVGQFSMANEPCMHIPYLYNYGGQSWKTQKRIRGLLGQWFRNDLMGNPGDEDGGGMTSFVVFSSLGFYPATPGIPAYSIGSPMFAYAKIQLDNGKFFEIEAKNCSAENKYIQSATLNGKDWNQNWFYHDDLKNGGKLVLQMGNRPNYNWGTKLPGAGLSAKSLKE
ncbi:MAG: GH92 family glycosyl hydrolase [Mariniphaga sp.]